MIGQVLASFFGDQEDYEMCYDDSNRTYLASSDDGGDGKQQSSKASKSSKKRQRQKLLKEQHQKQEGGSLPQPQAMAHQSSQNNTATIKNDLKSGPQVLIKNVNGKVVITPIPETQNPPPEPAHLPATNNMNVKAMPPQAAVVRSAVGNGVASAKARTAAAAAYGGKSGLASISIFFCFPFV